MILQQLTMILDGEFYIMISLTTTVIMQEIHVIFKLQSLRIIKGQIVRSNCNNKITVQNCSYYIKGWFFILRVVSGNFLNSIPCYASTRAMFSA